MQTIRTDSVIVEVRAIRDKYAAQFNYDVAGDFWGLEISTENLST